MTTYCHTFSNPNLVIEIANFPIEFLAIKFFPQRTKSVTIVRDRPPKSPSSIINIHDTQSKLSSVYPSMIILGDFNLDLLVPNQFSDNISKFSPLISTCMHLHTLLQAAPR